ncbi:GMC family oxidoreductase [Deltaproteobacteria bacterium Smac51]|nr:GMC family oxidoreductase [Deltaproteobacteria bacterium Smac51]
MARTMKHVDAVVVGMGFTGAIAAKELTDAGLNVVALERGPDHETATTAKAPQVFDELSFDVRGRIFQQLNLETVTFRHTAGDRAVPMRKQGAFLLGNGTGGAGFHWSGMHWRALATDLTHRSTVIEKYGEKFIPEGMQIQDFGVSYDDLEPYFTHFEEVCGVSGQAGNVKGAMVEGGNPFEAPRSKHYPQAPLPWAYASAQFAKAATEVGFHPFPAPASNSSGKYTNPYGVEMGQCTLCGFCNDFGCYVSAKASPQSTILPALRKTDKFQLRNDAHVLKVLLDSSGKKATGVVYINARGEEITQPADLVMLTAFQLHNVRLLLLSGIGQPFNSQDGTGTVGRNFCYQMMGGSRVIMPKGTWLNPYASAGAAAACIDDFNGDNFDHGPLGFIGGAGIWHNKSGARPITQAAPMPGSPNWGSGWKKGMAEGYQRITNVTSHGSVQPYRDVFLDLDPTYRDAYGMPLIRVTLNWHENEFKMSQFTSEQTAKIGRAMGAETVTMTNMKPGTPFNTTYYQTTHTTGGAIMGDDPKTSVINRYLQSWDVPNVFVYGSSAFPQNMGYNPTGLVGALAYWSTHHIKETYLKNPGPMVTK